MSSDASTIVITSKERILSSKTNRGMDLVHRMLQEALRATLGSDTDRTGVVHGLNVAVINGTMQCTVARGLALVYDATKVYPDSAWRWVEAETAITATASAADPANPRWDVVEIQAGTSATTTQRDIYDDNLDTFSSQSVTDERRSSPTVRVRSGTAAATPEFPAGATGWIPLAYLYIPAAAASINTTDVVHCRPLLRSGGAGDVGGEAVRTITDLDLRGGGVSATGGTVTVNRCTGRFPGSRHRFVVEGTVPPGATRWDGGSAPGADALAYFYAIKPPYPGGYDANLVDREFVPLTNARTRFPWGICGEGAVVIASTTAPAANDIQGAPAAGNGSLPAGPFDNAAIVSARANWVYLGCAFWDVSAVGWADQDTIGALVQVSTPTCTDLGAGGAATYSLRQSNGGPAGSLTHLLPATAIWIHTQVELSDSAQNVGANVSIDLNDEQTVPANVASWYFSAPYDAASVPFSRIRNPWWAKVNAAGQVTVFTVTGSFGTDVARIWAVAYRDAILEKRA